ncbi:MAG TPA: hypothetical protein VL020_01360 [Pseudomonadales bacterium]|nr:hypothetical protein [Pseudomonadales bacterium]
MSEAQQLDYDDYEEIDAEEVQETEEKASNKRGRSIDFEMKKRRAERILEQSRLREMFGYDVDYEDY